ncbi:MAG: hypothetical protein EBZ94_02510, partial [Crocinitomicaceae bacterium]|nr:hypothetical protein [Flavobacteriia bacterium]NDC28189.1 hypothetical protein [Crocinitomicaceae bacterium]
FVSFSQVLDTQLPTFSTKRISIKGTIQPVNKTSLNIESLAPGNYYLKIEEKNILLKVVKQ